MFAGATLCECPMNTKTVNIEGKPADNKFLDAKMNPRIANPRIARAACTLKSNVYFFIFSLQTNIVCRYFIYGMQDEQNLERVRLTFDKFNVPMSDKQCNDGYLKVKSSLV